MNNGWILLGLMLMFIHYGYGIICYHCHQTSKECNNGYVDDIHEKNCSENRCAVMKYETIMPGRKVLATLRDCSIYTKHELLQRVSPDMKNPAKIILFEECDTSLCNSSIQTFITNNVVMVIVSLITVLIK